MASSGGGGRGKEGVKGETDRCIGPLDTMGEAGSGGRQLHPHSLFLLLPALPLFLVLLWLPAAQLHPSRSRPFYS
eukprot:scaffold183982_cov27-Tisochrysis_lutea.AAC.1